MSEETGLDFKAKSIIGIYSALRKDLMQKAGFITQPVIIIFDGEILSNSQKDLHEDIAEVKWFTFEEIIKMSRGVIREDHIKQMFKDYRSNKRYPLDIIHYTIQE